MNNNVLVFSDYYLPGYKAGGPIKSITSIVDMLGDDFNFHVVTSARDMGESEHYQGVVFGQWTVVGKAQVRYEDTSLPAWRELTKLLAQDWSCIYLNSFFSRNTIKVLLALKMLRSPIPVLLAPRGEFSPGALQLKRLKKQIYLELAKLAGLYKRVRWHASTDREHAEIAAHFPEHAMNADNHNYFVAKNLSTHQPVDIGQPLDKQPGMLRVAFLSRVAPKKNLYFALEVLSRVPGDIVFDIWGPLEDESYWLDCKVLIEKAPSNLTISYKGAVTSKEVVPTLSNYHVFLFPTLGENFGHTILEAMTAGCAILISNTTPWLGLWEKGYGWDIPLSHPESFVDALTKAVYWDADKFAAVSLASRTAATSYLKQSDNLAANRRMFETVCSFTKR